MQSAKRVSKYVFSFIPGFHRNINTWEVLHGKEHKFNTCKLKEKKNTNSLFGSFIK